MTRLLALILGALAAGAAPQDPSGQEVLRRVEETFRGVHDYTARVEVQVDLERLKVPRMEATLYFKEPDRVHVASTGFAMLPREAMEFSPAHLRERYEAESADTVEEDGVVYRDLTLRPTGDRTKLRRAVLRVDTGTWLPQRLTVPLFDGRTIEARFRYVRAEGFWVPSGTDVTFSSTEADTSAPDPPSGVPTLRQSVPRKGSISIRYSDHQVNTGLPDSLFVQPAR